MWLRICLHYTCLGSFANSLFMKFYAVHAGRKPGIYNTWKECELQVKSFPGAKFKKFATLNEAQSFVKIGNQLANNFKVLQHTDFTQSCSSTASSCNKSKSTRQTKRKASETPSSSKLPKLQGSYNKDDEYIVVYTDGACSGNGKYGSSAGYGVWWGDDHHLNLSCKLEGTQTNQRAEIAAISAAIKQAKDVKIDKLMIKTDSMFVINCLTKWASSWKKNGWKKADGKEVVHKNQFIEILENMKSVEVRFDHVFGHQGVHGNEMADKLAVAGAKL